LTPDSFHRALPGDLDLLRCRLCGRTTTVAALPDGRAVLVEPADDGAYLLVPVRRGLPRLVEAGSVGPYASVARSSCSMFRPHWPACRRLDRAERAFATEVLGIGPDDDAAA